MPSSLLNAARVAWRRLPGLPDPQGFAGAFVGTGGEAWSVRDDAPLSLVTTPAVAWRGGFVLAGGEAAPRRRTPGAWWGRLP